MNKENHKKNINIFLYVLLISIFIVIIVSFYSFYFNKNYDFLIETKCDPMTDVCFFRDCISTPEICPANNLSYYNQYMIKAKDFKYCINEDCTQVCSDGSVECVKKICTESDINEGLCLVPLNNN